MTASDDFPRDDASHGPPEGPAEPDAPFDEDAAWREIVENYGERPRLGDFWGAPGTSGSAPGDPSGDPSGGAGGASDWADMGADPPEAASGSVFDRSFLDAYSEEVGAAAARPHGRRHDDDDHFVPPPPPPIPKGTPARRLAWLGVLAPPVLMVVAVLVRWAFPTWASFLLVVAFLGGFGFLVATMPRDPRDDGDDGAVV